MKKRFADKPILYDSIYKTARFLGGLPSQEWIDVRIEMPPYYKSVYVQDAKQGHIVAAFKGLDSASGKGIFLTTHGVTIYSRYWRRGGV